MFKRFTLLLLLTSSSMLVGGWSLYAQTTAIKSLYRTFNDTYETKADSMTNAFIESFMIKSKGIFNDTSNHYAFNAYWTQAHAIDVIIYAYQRHKLINAQLASKYLSYIKLWYKNKANNYSGAPASSSSSPNTSSDYKMFENPYTDDMCWITLTLLHIGEATGTSTYSIVARACQRGRGNGRTLASLEHRCRQRTECLHAVASHTHRSQTLSEVRHGQIP